MAEAFHRDAIRTPMLRHGQALSRVRVDDLGSLPLRALIDRNPGIDWDEVDNVAIGIGPAPATRRLLDRAGVRCALAAMSIGVVLGIVLLLERV